VTGWKPGDVAKVTWADHKSTYSEVAVRAAVGDVWLHGLDWGGGTVSDEISSPAARRLIVIDPETLDLAFIERAFQRWTEWTSLVAEKVAIRLVLDALHITPSATPKPTEPLGLGAVAVDTDGRAFTRVCTCGCPAPWVLQGSMDQAARLTWSEISAVNVLSEGVPPVGSSSNPTEGATPHGN
jgi:hypothetical protein